jgi:hypothetical protein
VFLPKAKALLQSGCHCVLLLPLIVNQAHAVDWGALNRSLALGAAVVDQDYQEDDTFGLTRDGVFNSESGGLSGFHMRARWQDASHLWLQAQVSKSAGRTDYQGYLQRSNGLSPYSATSGNDLLEVSLRAGWPLGIANGQAQCVPFLEFGRTTWDRRLVQYDERYTYPSAGLGFMLQWAVREAMTIELSVTHRQHRGSGLTVPKFEFDADFSSGKESLIELSTSWQVTPRWGLVVGLQESRLKSGGSGVINGLSAPPSSWKQNRASAGLQWFY